MFNRYVAYNFWVTKHDIVSVDIYCYDTDLFLHVEIDEICEQLRTQLIQHALTHSCSSYNGDNKTYHIHIRWLQKEGNGFEDNGKIFYRMK